jgi:hypothetical protein
MAALTKKHFQAIADILCEENAKPSMINAFGSYFRSENPRFDDRRFAEWIVKCKRKRGLSGPGCFFKGRGCR